MSTHSQNDELRALLRDLRERQNDNDASGDEVEAYGYAADRLQRVLTPAAVAGEAVDRERVAQLIAHRACCGTEHDPLNGKLHGYCVVCGVDWPCEYAGKPPTTTAPVVAGEAVRDDEILEAFATATGEDQRDYMLKVGRAILAIATAGDSAVGECVCGPQQGCTRPCNRERAKEIDDAKTIIYGIVSGLSMFDPQDDTQRTAALAAYRKLATPPAAQGAK